MLIRELNKEDKTAYENIATHPLQSWAWGNFRQKTGVEVVRIGNFEGEKLLSGFQLTFHQLPKLPYSIGYFPKGKLPDKQMIDSLIHIGLEKNAIFIKLEPNVIRSNNNYKFSIINYKLLPSPKPLFTKYTFLIDLTKTEEELLANMHPKTRYNVRLAQKRGVTIQEENTDQAFSRYLELTHETTSRQGFYAHDDNYHQQMWQMMRENNIAHLFTARFQGKILVTWILFLYKNILYYPYGASSSEFKEVMASNLMMWEAMRWGKKQGATIFDLWGTPGPDPKITDDYYGFHKFKLGYAPKLVEFIGTYDLILKQPHYSLFNIADKLRWSLLKLKTKINF